jgi:hypothetical protein
MKGLYQLGFESGVEPFYETWQRFLRILVPVKGIEPSRGVIPGRF